MSERTGRFNPLPLAEWLIWLACALPPTVAHAAESIEPLDSLREAVEGFLLQQSSELAGEVNVSVGRLDSRLRMPRCSQPLQPFWPAGGKRLGNVTVGLRCEAPKSWSLYVQAQVQQLAPVVVTGRPLSRGEVLGLQDVELVGHDLARLHSGYYGAPDEVAGMVMKRSVKAGMVLTPALLKPQLLIKRGEKVTILADTGAVQVRMEGKALMDGARGQVIRVRNLSSKREVEAAVVAPGIVQVRL
jgi:flagella basal body P-ring formation protein FlgA